MRRGWLVFAAGLLALFTIPLVVSSAPSALPAEDFFTPSELAQAAAYNSRRLPVALGAWLLGLIVTGIIAMGPGARRLGAWAVKTTRGKWQLTALLLASITAMTPTLVNIPFTLFRHRNDVAFGLATNSTTSALRDLAVATTVSVVMSALAAVGFVALAKAAPRKWPWVTSIAGAGALVVIVLLMPVIYEPLFNDFEPVDRVVAERVFDVAKKSGVEVASVAVADASRRTSARNAYVSGLGSTRRVVIYDTLLASSSPQELDLVVAHELAHVKHRDVAKATALGAAGVVLGVLILAALVRRPEVRALTGASGAHDPRIVPFLAAYVAFAGVITLPLQNAVSRVAESRADRSAIAVTMDPATALDLEVALTRANLSNPEPNQLLHRIFGTHPTSMERITSAIEQDVADDEKKAEQG